MQHFEGATRAFQQILSSVKIPEPSGDFAAQFAIKRFAKKFEVPSGSDPRGRKDKTFRQWVDFDSSLTKFHLPHGSWYVARLKCLDALRSFRIGELTFTSGSSSQPLWGRQSVADKLLTHDWEVANDDCADVFVDLAVNDKAFIKAAKIKLRRSLGDKGYRETVKRIYRINSSGIEVKKFILYSALVRREASRYAVVPKNNLIDRSIDLQPFINMVVQRAVGLGLREVLKKDFDVDLEELQPIHGHLIRDMSFSTLDLRNASDSNTWQLLEFMTPPWFARMLRSITPEYVEGFDGHYYATNKISSMGNGFTFELMTLFLLSLVRSFDSRGSVYGDDIIVSKDKAEQVILALKSTGWVVNEEKSFIDGPFRESCGYNYHVDHGYIRSFDFQFPRTIGDCVVFWNKCVLLGHIPFFRSLQKLLKRAIPPALRGPIPHGIGAGPTHLHDEDLGSYFFIEDFTFTNDPWLGGYAAALNYDFWCYHQGVEFRPRVAIPARQSLSMRRNAHLYFQYFYAGRRSPIVFTGRGDWVSVGFFNNGIHPTRVNTLKKLYGNL